MDEESTDNSLWDFLGNIGDTAGKVYSAVNAPKAAPPAARAAQPQSNNYTVPLIIGVALLIVGVILSALLGGRR